MPQDDASAGVSGDGDAQPSDEVLAEVHDRPAGRRNSDGDRSDLLRTSHGWAGGGHQGGHVPVDDSDSVPSCTVVAGLRPSARFQPGVVRLPVVQARLQHGARGGEPVLVRGDALGRSVREEDVQLGEESEPIAVDGAAALEAEPATEPSVTEQSADHVLALDQEVRDVVRLVTQPAVVRGPTWRQHMVTDAVAVDLRLVHAERRRVQAGGSDRGPELEGPSQKGHRTHGAGVVVPVGADEPCRPVLGGEESSFHDGRGTPWRGCPGGVGDPYPHAHPLS